MKTNNLFIPLIWVLVASSLNFCTAAADGDAKATKFECFQQYLSDHMPSTDTITSHKTTIIVVLLVICCLVIACYYAKKKYYPNSTLREAISMIFQSDQQLAPPEPVIIGIRQHY